MDKIEVSQRAREAVIPYLQDSEWQPAEIRCGEADSHWLTQLLARFERDILATRTDATPVAWMYDKPKNGRPYNHDRLTGEERRPLAVLDGWTETPLFSHPPATDVAALVEAARAFQHYGCPVCSGDCGSANPPVMACPMQALSAALAPFTKGQNDVR